MPGWHEQLQQFAKDNPAGQDIQVVGIIQEQHPQRCRLLMQWKQMDFPILIDPLNSLGVKVVPLTLLLDEAGTVISTRAKARHLNQFANLEPVDGEPLPAEMPTLQSATTLTAGTPSELRDLADRLVLWGKTNDIDRAIELYRQAAMQSPEDGSIAFRMGVAHARRHDTLGEPGDFAAAITAWQHALELDPNQYIWRRRIQQYGPRLDKPYPFYDWVLQAREDIAARGETPLPLPVEPRGAELAGSLKTFRPAGEGVVEPDPDGVITRDNGEHIAIETIHVPDTSGKPVARVHLLLRPNPANKTHWSNETEPLTCWVGEPPTGWVVDRRRVRLTNPTAAVSNEMRSVEFELRQEDPDAADEPLRGYLLYNICEGEEGTCLYRRQDFVIPLSR